MLGCGSSEPEAPLRNLPFEYIRDDVGMPVSEADIAKATAQMREIVQEVPYFKYVAERVHGWPSEDPQGRYWYGTWWSGVRIERAGTQVTFRHSPDGADNNGLRTAPLLEAACYAQALWPSPEHEELIHTLIRGFSSWIRAMERTSAPNAPVLMTRASYPESISYSRGGLDITIDYDSQHPGEDNGATEYVHIPDNPEWGDIWIKNKRSKDDIGYMLRALMALQSCRANLSAPVLAEIDDTMARYEAWAQQVEMDNFRISTYNKDLEVYIPNESLAILIQVSNAECDAILSVRLMGNKDEGEWDCRNGITEADALAASLNPGVRRIFVSFHEALARLMVERGDPDRAKRIVKGLAARLDTFFARRDAGELTDGFNHSDFGGEVVNAANIGVPLTSREVRYLHERIDAAHQALLDPGQKAAREVFRMGGSDGTFGMELPNTGFNFRELGVLLGVCASHRVNLSSRPVLNCESL